MSTRKRLHPHDVTLILVLSVLVALVLYSVVSAVSETHRERGNVETFAR